LKERRHFWKRNVEEKLLLIFLQTRCSLFHACLLVKELNIIVVILWSQIFSRNAFKSCRLFSINHIHAIYIIKFFDQQNEVEEEKQNNKQKSPPGKEAIFGGEEKGEEKSSQFQCQTAKEAQKGE
jgi:hypothetical protein